MKTFGKIALIALAASSLTVPAVARQGADNAPGDVRQCRGCDDPAGHVRQEDRSVRSTSTAREVQSNDVRRSRGADDAPGHVRGGGADDPRPHN